jgi:hypothetical protein
MDLVTFPRQRREIQHDAPGLVERDDVVGFQMLAVDASAPRRYCVRVTRSASGSMIQ